MSPLPGILSWGLAGDTRAGLGYDMWRSVKTCYAGFFLVKAFIVGEETHVTDTQRKRLSVKQRGTQKAETSLWCFKWSVQCHFK